MYLLIRWTDFILKHNNTSTLKTALLLNSRLVMFCLGNRIAVAKSILREREKFYCSK